MAKRGTFSLKMIKLRLRVVNLVLFVTGLNLKFKNLN